MLAMALSAGAQTRLGATCRMLANRPVAHLVHYLFLEACGSRSLSNADQSCRGAIDWRAASIGPRYPQGRHPAVAREACTGRHNRARSTRRSVGPSLGCLE